MTLSPATRETKQAPRERIGGRYELLMEIAAGGMATVHVARSRGSAGFGRLVAIKCCHAHLRHDEDFARMFLDEARLVGELRHPNVVATLDFGEDEALSLYIVMEYVDGFSLLQLQRASRANGGGGRLPLKIALRVVIDALQGLQAAHTHADPRGIPLNIVHRDVSPQNILLGVDGSARILDFGIARAESRVSHTRDGNIKGKTGYMAPEQHGLFSEEAPQVLTHQADLYAMGVVLWESLAGKKLFQRENDTQTIRAAMEAIVPSVSEFSPDAPASIDVIIAKALHRDLTQRIASANAFVIALEECGVTAATPRETSEWVRTLLGAHIESRHQQLRKLADEPTTDDEANKFLDRVVSTATNAHLARELADGKSLPQEHQGEIEMLTVESVPPPPPPSLSEARPTSKRSLVWGLALTLVLTLGSVAVWASVRKPTQSAGISTAVVTIAQTPERPITPMPDRGEPPRPLVETTPSNVDPPTPQTAPRPITPVATPAQTVPTVRPVRPAPNRPFRPRFL
ncbi:MAG: protein kinase [Deltaproteobacteria bacterium]|nr:protein kinase [Deltaproteobacteria bacterium]